MQNYTNKSGFNVFVTISFEFETKVSLVPFFLKKNTLTVVRFCSPHPKCIGQENITYNMLLLKRITTFYINKITVSLSN